LQETEKKIKEIEKEVEKLKAAGWTQKDFAEKLKELLPLE